MNKKITWSLTMKKAIAVGIVLIIHLVLSAQLTEKSDYTVDPTKKLYRDFKILPNGKVEKFSALRNNNLRDITLSLSASNGLENRIELNWQVSGYGEVVFADNFDTYNDGDLAFNDWITLDLDGGLTYEFVDQYYHFPHPNEAFAWTIANWENSNVTSHSAPNTIAALGNMDGIANNDWLITPILDLSTSTAYNDACVNFWVNPVGEGLSTVPEHIKVLYSSGSTDPDDFTLLDEFFLDEKDVWKYISIPLTSCVGEEIRIAINYCSDQNICVAVDDFEVIAYPEVITAYNVYRSDTADGNFEIIAETTEMSYADFFVTSDQTYYYKVSAMLNNETESNFSNVASGYSVGTSVTEFPYQINFDNVTPPDLPVGCLVENANQDANTWNTHDAGEFSPPNCLKYVYHPDNAADDWFFTPPMILMNNANYHIVFKYRGNHSFYTEKLEVMVGQYAAAEGMEQQLFDNDNIHNEDYIDAAINFSPVDNGPYVIGWHVYSDADQAALFLDNIEITMFLDADENTLITPLIALTNYPNPFNPSTEITFNIEHSTEIELSIYNSNGQKINTLAKKEFEKGVHSILWDGTDFSGNSVSSGVYLYNLILDRKTHNVKKCILIK